MGLQSCRKCDVIKKHYAFEKKKKENKNAHIKNFWC